jgi:Ca-activated chloride channel family protein
MKKLKILLPFTIIGLIGCSQNSTETHTSNQEKIVAPQLETKKKESSNIKEDSLNYDYVAPVAEYIPAPAPVVVSQPRPKMAMPMRMPMKIPSPMAQESNTEGYNIINENQFKEVKTSPLSTFSIDVDTASYSNIRRYLLQNNKLPPKGAVRIEEMINYFSYSYKEPTNNDPFHVNSSVKDSIWNKKSKIIQIGLQSKKPDISKLPASNLVFLLDVSGSMGQPNKLPLLKKSLKLLVKQLRKKDSVSIVVYAGNSGLVLDRARGDEEDKIIQALEKLNSGGSTAGGAGIKLAYKIAQKAFIDGGNNRVILATDGDFNVGQSSQSALVELIEEKKKSGIFLTVLGFGMGNYKDSKMEQLADKGNGNYAYIDNLLEAKKVLVTQMSGTLYTVAKDVKIQVEFNPTKVHSYRLIGYENRKMANEDFNNDKKDAGEIGMGHSVTALYEIVLNSDEVTSKVDKLKYQTTTATGSKELATVKIRYKKPDEDTSTLMSRVINLDSNEIKEYDSNFAQSVAGFGMILRKSEHKKDLKLSSLIELAKSSKGEDREGYRAEFIKMMEKAELLK